MKLFPEDITVWVTFDNPGEPYDESIEIPLSASEEAEFLEVSRKFFEWQGRIERLRSR